MSVLKEGKVVGKWTVRLPAGSVVDAASNPAHSSPRLGAPYVEVYVPASRIDRKNDKVNIATFSDGEVVKANLPTKGLISRHFTVSLPPRTKAF